MHAWPAYIRALTYPILFDERPIEGMDRVLATVVDTGASGSREEFLHAIDEALASEDDLAKLFSENHTDQVLRGFLAELSKVLRARGPEI
jgi:hypothetical protein